MDNSFYINAKEKEEDWKKKIVTPRVAAVGIVESPDGSKLLMIERKYPPIGLAFPGGMMELGETVEEAAIREVSEETGIDAEVIGLLNVLSDPKYDPRWHVVVIYLVMRAKEMKDPKGMDDAKDAFWVNIENMPKQIVESTETVYNDYLTWKRKEWDLVKTK